MDAVINQIAELPTMPDTQTHVLREIRHAQASLAGDPRETHSSSG
jgi:hypothetical protein